MMQFMDSIPYSNDEAAMLEGASYFYIFRKLIIPLLKPAIATIIIILASEFIMISIHHSFMRLEKRWEH